MEDNPLIEPPNYLEKYFHPLCTHVLFTYLLLYQGMLFVRAPVLSFDVQ